MYLIFVASLNENMKLAHTIEENLKALNKEAEIINLVDLELPMYDTNKEANDGIPPIIKQLGDKMDKAKGFIFIAPEYNYSIPPVLTNFIAWISRFDENFRKFFNEKMILLATHSGSGGNDVVAAMRTQFSKLGAFVMPREIITTYTHELHLDSLQRVLTQFIKFSS